MYTDIKTLSTLGTWVPVLTTGNVGATSYLYTSPAGKRSQLTDILIHNTNTTPENVILHINSPNLQNRIINITVIANDSVWINQKPICLEGGDYILGGTTTASKVTFLITGRVET